MIFMNGKGIKVLAGEATVASFPLWEVVDKFDKYYEVKLSLPWENSFIIIKEDTKVMTEEGEIRTFWEQLLFLNNR